MKHTGAIERKRIRRPSASTGRTYSGGVAFAERPDTHLVPAFLIIISGREHGVVSLGGSREGTLKEIVVFFSPAFGPPTVIDAKCALPPSALFSYFCDRTGRM